jgi:hypothetical protein
MRELIEEKIETRTYIAPELLENHEARLAYLDWYVETSEFKYLDIEIKNLIERHYEERTQMAAKKAELVGQAPAPQGEQAGGAPPQDPLSMMQGML